MSYDKTTERGPIARSNAELKDLVEAHMGIFPVHMDEIVSNHGKLRVAGLLGPDMANKAAVTWPFTFKPELGNIHEKLHGGVAAYIVDAITSVHLALVDGRHQHVSMHLSLNYIKPVPLGEEVHVRTFINGSGKTVAFLEAEFWSADGKVLFLTATHSKIFLNAKRQLSKL